MAICLPYLMIFNLTTLHITTLSKVAWPRKVELARAIKKCNGY